jgi:hypothetical protein
MRVNMPEIRETLIHYPKTSELDDSFQTIATDISVYRLWSTAEMIYVQPGDKRAAPHTCVRAVCTLETLTTRH